MMLYLKSKELRVLQIGYGKLGYWLKTALEGQGHSTFVIRRNECANSMSVDSVFSRGVDCFSAEHPVDVILLSIGDFCETDSMFVKLKHILTSTNYQHIPIVSVCAKLSILELKKLFGARPYVRFCCSAAVNDHNSMRFFDQTGSEHSYMILNQLLPSQKWIEVQDFEKFVKLFIATALQLKLLSEYTNFLELSELTSQEQTFLNETPVEVQRLISTFNNNPLEALSSATTPNGITEKIAKRFFK